MENAESIDSEMKQKKRKSQKTYSASPEPSIVSMKSNLSLPVPPELSDGSVTSEPL